MFFYYLISSIQIQKIFQKQQHFLLIKNLNINAFFIIIIYNYILVNINILLLKDKNLSSIYLNN